ncbi:hypothetical protein HYR99_29030 [Candidatus Poribacteria bacterium]|nr:hypothetical protein [Candidatus Poribacteria bacterium]
MCSNVQERLKQLFDIISEKKGGPYDLLNIVRWAPPLGEHAASQFSEWLKGGSSADFAAKVARFVPSLKMKAWESFMARYRNQPFPGQLRDFLETAPLLREQAAQYVLIHCPTNENLLAVIEYVESYRESAGQELLGQKPTNYELLKIIERVGPLRNQAWSKLLEQGPTVDDLCTIINNVNALRDHAWNYLLKQGTVGDWVEVAKKIKPLRDDAWQQVLKRKPANYLLTWIIENGGPLKERAALQILNNSDSVLDLYKVIKHVKSLRNEARERVLNLLDKAWEEVSNHPTPKDLAPIIFHAPDIDIVEKVWQHILGRNYTVDELFSVIQQVEDLKEREYYLWMIETRIAENPDY